SHGIVTHPICSSYSDVDSLVKSPADHLEAFQLTSSLSPSSQLTPSQMKELIADLQSMPPDGSSHACLSDYSTNNVGVPSVNTLNTREACCASGFLNTQENMSFQPDPEASLGDNYNSTISGDTVFVTRLAEVTIPPTNNTLVNAFIDEITASDMQDRTIYSGGGQSSGFTTASLDATKCVEPEELLLNTSLKRPKMTRDCTASYYGDEQSSERLTWGSATASAPVVLPTLRSLLQSDCSNELNEPSSYDNHSYTQGNYSVDGSSNPLCVAGDSHAVVSEQTMLISNTNTQVQCVIGSLASNSSFESVDTFEGSGSCSQSPILERRIRQSGLLIDESIPNPTFENDGVHCVTYDNEDTQTSVIRRYGNLHLGETVGAESGPLLSSFTQNDSFSTDLSVKNFSEASFLSEGVRDNCLERPNFNFGCNSSTNFDTAITECPSPDVTNSDYLSDLPLTDEGFPSVKSLAGPSLIPTPTPLMDVTTLNDIRMPSAPLPSLLSQSEPTCHSESRMQTVIDTEEENEFQPLTTVAGTTIMSCKSNTLAVSPTAYLAYGSNADLPLEVLPESVTTSERYVRRSVTANPVQKLHNNELIITKKVRPPPVYRPPTCLVRCDCRVRETGDCCGTYNWPGSWGRKSTTSSHIRGRGSDISVRTGLATGLIQHGRGNLNHSWQSGCSGFCTALPTCRRTNTSSHIRDRLSGLSVRGCWSAGGAPFVRHFTQTPVRANGVGSRPAAVPFNQGRKRSAVRSAGLVTQFAQPANTAFQRSRKDIPTNAYRVHGCALSGSHAHRTLGTNVSFSCLGSGTNQCSCASSTMSHTSTTDSYSTTGRKMAFHSGLTHDVANLTNNDKYHAPAAKVISYTTTPSLHQMFPEFSLRHSCRIRILEQPESQHRARYQTEGSRGAVKDRSGCGFPTIQLIGWDGRASLQVFVAAEVGRPKPHPFYQAYLVAGKLTKYCVQTIREGVNVIEMPFPSSNNWKLSVECVGILKLRKSDVEQRTTQPVSTSTRIRPTDLAPKNDSSTSLNTNSQGTTSDLPQPPLGSSGTKPFNRKPGKARLVFRVVLVHERSGIVDVIQTISEPILCTQLIGDPEICRISLAESNQCGGQDLFILGKNLGKDCRVLFRQLADMSGLKVKLEEANLDMQSEGTEDNQQPVVHWQQDAIMESDFSHQTHLVCRVPAYDGPQFPLTSPLLVQLIVRSGQRWSNPVSFVYRPDSDILILNRASTVTGIECPPVDNHTTHDDSQCTSMIGGKSSDIHSTTGFEHTQIFPVFGLIIQSKSNKTLLVRHSISC
ncbi:hypothetical protein PHET_03432, partial [Paragonimus heterotremus]